MNSSSYPRRRATDPAQADTPRSAGSNHLADYIVEVLFIALLAAPFVIIHSPASIQDAAAGTQRTAASHRRASRRPRITRSRAHERYREWLDLNLRVLVVLEIKRETARVYAQVRSELQRLGKPMSTNDLWFAALGREHELPVMTRDQHFKFVPGLRAVSW